MFQRQPAREAAGHDLHRVGGLGHVGDLVEDVEDALGAGRRLLRHRHDAAHRIEPAIEAAHIGQEGGQRTDGDVILGD